MALSAVEKRDVISEKTSKCSLIGGQSHGIKIDISDDVDSIDIPVYWDVSGPTSFRYFDTYTRRLIVDVPRYGDQWIYFGHIEDDDVDTEALARRMRSEESNG